MTVINTVVPNPATMPALPFDPVMAQLTTTATPHANADHASTRLFSRLAACRITNGVAVPKVIRGDSAHASERKRVLFARRPVVSDVPAALIREVHLRESRLPPRLNSRPVRIADAAIQARIHVSILDQAIAMANRPKAPFRRRTRRPSNAPSCRDWVPRCATCGLGESLSGRSMRASCGETTSTTECVLKCAQLASAAGSSRLEWNPLQFGGRGSKGPADRSHQQVGQDLHDKAIPIETTGRPDLMQFSGEIETLGYQVWSEQNGIPPHFEIMQPD